MKYMYNKYLFVTVNLKNIIRFSLLLIFVTLYSCKENNNDNYSLKHPYSYKEYYTNGKVSLIQDLIITNIGDTVENGIHREYDSLGNLLVEASIKIGKKDGYVKNLYPNGKLSYYAHFNNDIQEGLESFYDTKGQSTFEGYFLHGQPFGKQIKYGENGLKDTLTFFTLHNEIWAIVAFNKERKPQINGRNSYLVFNKSELKVGDSLIVINYVLNDKTIRTKFKISIKDSLGPSLLDTVIDKFVLYNHTYCAPLIYMFRKPGKYYYEYEASTFDDITGKLLLWKHDENLIEVL